MLKRDRNENEHLISLEDGNLALFMHIWIHALGNQRKVCVREEQNKSKTKCSYYSY